MKPPIPFEVIHFQAILVSGYGDFSVGGDCLPDFLHVSRTRLHSAHAPTGYVPGASYCVACRDDGPAIDPWVKLRGPRMGVGRAEPREGAVRQGVAEAVAARLVCARGRWENDRECQDRSVSSHGWLLQMGCAA